jgi:DnaJ-class molecular chaperone
MGIHSNDQDASKDARHHPGDETEPGSEQSAEGICPECGGSGSVAGNTCASCDGTGVVTVIVGDA